MAHHKKKRHPAARAHCHMCKPWKDGGYSHDNPNFEKWSAHKKRVLLKQEIKEIMTQYDGALKKLADS